MEYQEKNSNTIDSWVDEGWKWSMPLTHEEFESVRNGTSFPLFLTPTKAIPKSWLGDLLGKKVLALASGGGQQSAILSASGAMVTVLDNSRKMLEKDEEVAKREGYFVKLMKHDMTKGLPFPDREFDVIVNPISNCYIEDVIPLWKECHRVLKHGGILVAGTEMGLVYALSRENEALIENPLPYNPLRSERSRKDAEEHPEDGVQFSHTIEENIQGQIDAGFVITNIFSDTAGYGILEEMNIPTYLATRAVKMTDDRIQISD